MRSGQTKGALGSGGYNPRLRFNNEEEGQECPSSLRVGVEDGDRKVPLLDDAVRWEESGGGYILSRMAWPKPEQESSVTSSRPSRRMRRARS